MVREFYKAQILYQTAPVEQKPLRYESVPFPEVSRGQLLIKVLSCGVCLTDRQIMEGEVVVKKLPIILGHQIVGIVEKMGPLVSKFQVGDKVGIPWLGFTCGHCYYCQHDKENLCENAEFTGRDINGGYAEYTKADEAFAIKLPSDIDPISFAPLLCSGIVGYRSYKLSEIRPGEHLGLFGFGSSAHIVIQIAKYQGCKISVFTRSKAHQEEAKKLGASFVGNADSAPPFPLDSAIIFAPSGSLVHPALQNLRRGGTLAFNAIHASPIPELEYKQIYYEKKLLSVANATREDAREFLEIASIAGITAHVKTYPLSQANEAHLDLKNGVVTDSIVLIP